MDSKLAPRLRKVLRFKALGYPNQVIAKEMNLELTTVEKHCTKIRKWLIHKKWWDADPFSRTAWGYVGKRYLAAIGEELEVGSTVLPPSSEVVIDELIGFLKKALDEIQGVRKRGEFELTANWEKKTIDELVNWVSRGIGVHDSYALGNKLLLMSNDLFQNQQRFRESLPWFRAAEVAFGKGSTQAAQAARDRVAVLWQLGDHDQARKESTRIENVYGSIMDVQTKTQLWQMQGVLELYDGNLEQAALLLRKCQYIAEQLEDDRFSDHHFLARVYLEFGRKRLDQRDEYFQQAIVEVDQAIAQARTDEHLAFHLLIKAQLFRLQRKWYEALQVRDMIRPLFGNTLAAAHLGLEEGRIALLRNNTKVAADLAQEALTGWPHIHFAKGIADALQLKGYSFLEAEPSMAFQYLVAAFYVYPYKNHPNNDTLVKAIYDLVQDQDRSAVRNWIKTVKNKVETERGPFEYLSFVAAERKPHIEYVVSWLENLSK
jgi:tetratricopeptide (TPR) repeat protein